MPLWDVLPEAISRYNKDCCIFQEIGNQDIFENICVVIENFAGSTAKSQIL